MEYSVTGANIIVLAIAVWFIGMYINTKLPFLIKYNIPVAVTGGLLCSGVVTILHYAADIDINFDMALRDILLLIFFSTIGLSAKFGQLRAGGKPLVLLVFAAIILLILQNITGIIMVSAMGAHPGYGLLGGSVSLAGGHGTTIAWGGVAEADGLLKAKEVGIAFATLGLIAGGLIGGPLAQRLITKHNLSPRKRYKKRIKRTYHDEVETEVSEDVGDGEDLVIEESHVSAVLSTMMILAICFEAGNFVNNILADQGMTLPGFLTAMMVGIVITNMADAFKFQLSEETLNRMGNTSLQLFLAMSLMSMQLWVLAENLGQILIVMFAQMIVITMFAVWILFRIMGKDYDAAVIVAGFTGLGLGATPVGIANMSAVTSKYGPSTKAFLIVPLVGAFLLDIANAFIIKTFLAMPFMQVAAGS